jgi:hypothetical protein
MKLGERRSDRHYLRRMRMGILFRGSTLAVLCLNFVAERGSRNQDSTYTWLAWESAYDIRHLAVSGQNHSRETAPRKIWSVCALQCQLLGT